MAIILGQVFGGGAGGSSTGTTPALITVALGTVSRKSGEFKFINVTPTTFSPGDIIEVLDYPIDRSDAEWGIIKVVADVPSTDEVRCFWTSESAQIGNRQFTYRRL